MEATWLYMVLPHYTEKTQRLQGFRKRSTLQFHYSAHHCAL